MPFLDYNILSSGLNNMVANDSYSISRLHDLGKTHDKNSILAVSIGNKTAAKSLFVGCHHANEWMSVEIPFLLAKYLITNYANPVIGKLVDCRQIWIIPMLNPDGHEYSQSVRTWRKNRRFNGYWGKYEKGSWKGYILGSSATLKDIFDVVKYTYGPKNWEEIYDANAGVLKGLSTPVNRSATALVPAGTKLKMPCYGVDINRNYDYEWDKKSRADSSNSNKIYHNCYWGPSPGSEPEVKILKSLMNRSLPAVSSVIGSDPFRAVISYHTSGQYIYYPWNYQNKAINDTLTLDLAKGMSDLTHQAGARYTAGCGADPYIGYPTYGDFSDWVWSKFKIPNYTFELDTTQLSNPANISNVFKINLHAALALINCTHHSTQFSYHVSAPSSGNVYTRSGRPSSACDIAIGAHSWSIWGAGYPGP